MSFHPAFLYKMKRVKERCNNSCTNGYHPNAICVLHLDILLQIAYLAQRRGMFGPQRGTRNQKSPKKACLILQMRRVGHFEWPKKVIVTLKPLHVLGNAVKNFT